MVRTCSCSYARLRLSFASHVHAFVNLFPPPFRTGTVEPGRRSNSRGRARVRPGSRVRETRTDTAFPEGGRPLRQIRIGRGKRLRRSERCLGKGAFVAEEGAGLEPMEGQGTPPDAWRARHVANREGCCFGHPPLQARRTCHVENWGVRKGCRPPLSEGSTFVPIQGL